MARRAQVDLLIPGEPRRVHDVVAGWCRGATVRAPRRHVRGGRAMALLARHAEQRAVLLVTVLGRLDRLEERRVTIEADRDDGTCEVRGPIRHARVARPGPMHLWKV